MARILLVDDDERVRDATESLLQAYGHTVDTARDGVEALALLAGETHYDLVISDYRMPKLNGFELLKEVRKTHTPEDLPFIIQSGEVTPALMDTWEQAGAFVVEKAKPGFMEVVQIALGL